MKKWLGTLAVFATLSSAVHAMEGHMSVARLPNNMSYFDITISNDGALNGTWEGWCADWGRLIEDGVQYHAKIYSPYSPIPEGIVDKPENLDEMNWLINKKFVGKSSPGGHGVYTTGDVQLAIWTLLDDNFSASTVGPYSQARVDEIVDKALRCWRPLSKGL